MSHRHSCFALIRNAPSGIALLRTVRVLMRILVDPGAHCYGELMTGLSGTPMNIACDKGIRPEER
jgi:hypothetical protein